MSSGPRGVHRRWALLGSLCLWSMAGCMSTPTPTVSTAPYFKPEAKDLVAIQSIGRQQEASIAKCASAHDCDQALFLKGLTSLFENREAAKTYFQRVVALPQRSRFTQASQKWLQLLTRPSLAQNPSWFAKHQQVDEALDENMGLSVALEQVVRDLLSREGDVQRLLAARDAESATVTSLQQELADRQKRLDELNAKKEKEKEPVKPAPDPAPLAHLQAQIEQRDKKIAELTHQLDALKRIDQETREKARPIRPPTAVGEGEAKP